MDFNPWEGLAKVTHGPSHAEMECWVGSKDAKHRGASTGIGKPGQGESSQTGRILVTSANNMELGMKKMS